MSPADGRDGTEPTILQALTHGRTLFSMLMFSIFAVMVYVAWGYPWPAHFLPFVIGFPGMARATSAASSATSSAPLWP